MFNQASSLVNINVLSYSSKFKVSNNCINYCKIGLKLIYF